MANKILAFGEIMLRLTPRDKELISNSASFGACYGGSEGNVLVGLSSLGNKTEYLTAIPDNELGEAVLKHLKAHGVGTSFIKKQGDILGMYFLEEGFGGRKNKVIYNRSSSEITHLNEESFDYDCIFKDCSVFHISGISFFLSTSVKKLCFRLLKEAKKRNITVSFDFNYRAKLSSIKTASEIYREIVPFADILFCSEKDLTVFLDTNILDFYKNYTCKYLIVREREILPDSKHKICVRGYEFAENSPKSTQSEQAVFPVLERIGSGDAFDAGILHSLSNGQSLSSAIKFGLACLVLKHTLYGDVFTLNEAAVNGYISDSLGDVIR